VPASAGNHPDRLKKPFLLKLESKATAMTGPIICGNCGSISQEPKSGNRGSLILEILLWLFFILPGIIYTIWRRRGKPCCPKCGSENIMPLNTPGGQETKRKFGHA
jgi:hypothetical protein